MEHMNHYQEMLLDQKTNQTTNQDYACPATLAVPHAMDLAKTTAQDASKTCCFSLTNQSASRAVQMVTQLTSKIGNVKLAMVSAKHVI